MLREWNLSVPISKLTFDLMPLWVRVTDLPPSFLFVENAKLIGAMFDKFMEMDKEVVHSGFGQGYLRFKVLFDIRKPLILGFLLPM